MFCYDKLWKLSIDRHMDKVEIRDAVKITPTTLVPYG